MSQQQTLARGRSDAKKSTQVEVTDADPPANTEETWELVTRAAIIAIGLLSAIAALYIARSFFMPVMAAMIIGITLSPIQKRAAEYGIPPVIPAAVLVLLFFGGLYLGVSLIVGQLTDWTAHAAELGETIKQKLRYLDRPLGAARDLLAAMGAVTGESGQKVSIETNITQVAQATLGVLTPALTEFIIFSEHCCSSWSASRSCAGSSSCTSAPAPRGCAWCTSGATSSRT